MSAVSHPFAWVVVFRFVFGSTGVPTEGPPWRGPDRTTMSGETDLSKEWPKDGPPLARFATGFGNSGAPNVFTSVNHIPSSRPDTGVPQRAVPVAAIGQCFLRDDDTLLCCDGCDPGRQKNKVPDAAFVPTPHDVVKRMLDMAKVTKDDTVYDLGSGDGRIVIAAAKRFGCKAVGVEIEKDLIKTSRDRAAKAGVEKLVVIERADLFEADITPASVVALYLLPTMNEKLIPKLNSLKAGSRVIAHCFPIPGIGPDRTVEVTSTEDDVKHRIYLYSVPLKLETPGR